MSQNYTAIDRYRRYHDVTVHFRPIYHKIFTYEKIVVLDVDFEFRSPLDELYRHLKQMSPNQIIAVSYDQTPYYRAAFRKYRTKNLLTSIGNPSPGHQQLVAQSTKAVVTNKQKALGEALMAELKLNKLTQGSEKVPSLSLSLEP
ncbi:hypothetical protein QYM36_020090 [Artemia franciscana]|uniref:Uncharacterized protein n=1 Tax=Artemia franciscana TaxID=6661 RepID=A0AA88H0F1_ARTSF|nr:hypothetical protein QYM36_020090 [Artemia franciscana]